ncbi:hypothetical protein [Sulfitobacter delicatus]|uniref:Uncharacterized protein n=1 Tax=Sulfitobacter delicatus TaxID=218672 RepID=A0A1G7S5C8_9RHOB|nr:hypothetical protein [Sulfitobacter delicatus]SDG18191.1 hypothetical protein SAMN04489759_10594 [Sulfitobacter delicatus]
MFFLSDREGQKLKTYSGTSRAGKHILKIEVEYSRALDMAMDVESLDAIATAQKEAAKASRARPKSTAKPKQIEKAPRLALPAPGESP